MKLNRDAREYYRLQISAETSAGTPVELDAWEASFDRGQTWQASTIATWGDDDWASWLVAGPDAENTDAVAVITRSCTPIVRVTDSPEVVVRDAPPIHLN